MTFAPLLLLFLLYLQTDWPPAPFDLTPDQAIVLSIAAQGLVVVTAAILAGVTRFRLRLVDVAELRLELLALYATGVPLRFRLNDRSPILRAFSRGKFRIAILSIAVFLACLYGLGWGWAMKQFIVGWWTPFLKPVLLLPYLVGMVMSWFFYYETDRAAHDDFWGGSDYHSRSAYIVLHLRHNFLLLAPQLLLMMGLESLHLFVGDGEQSDDVPILYIALLAGLLVTALILLPYALRLLLGLRPMPSGPVRDHLLATAKRLRFRVSDILVWNTRRTQANALVTGMLPILRYVVLTDRMLEEFSIEEIEAVFGHEVGHIKHHHMPFYMLFLILSLVILGTGYELATQWVLPTLKTSGSFLADVVDHREWYLGLVAVYMFVCFGYLSRRCERQADLFGCHVAGFPPFIRALEKVADINGIPRQRPGWFAAWQHGTIAERVDFLRRTDVEPDLESTFQRRFAWVKWTSLASLAVAVGVLVAFKPWEWLRYL